MIEPATTQGYITMAYGHRRFFEMAVNLALSARLNDPNRPVTLLYKDCSELPEELAPYFQDCRPFENPEAYPGVTIKLGVYEPSPYEETFFVDADCLIMKRDMDRHWEKYGAQDFAISGDVVKSGAAYGCDVEKMMAAAGVDYFCDMNCGVLFFRKSDKAQKVFADARALLAERHPDLIELRPRRGDGLSDQPYFAAAMARNGVEPVSYTPEEGTIMATTWRASDIEFDLEHGINRLKKPTGFRLMDRFWARGWVSHETSIAHFIELKPRAAYQRLSDWLRDHFGVPRFRFD
ncbi:hypothetical protein PUV54_13475 [Hyphococcus flavus]|uniref:Nucleotide-diphospho-sugar transferase domain-containing protein n=1 Tax=Hyphococcus flavus TaxID=1866326 RepID=A0AAE9ZCJ8_9PROT|nr:hypothetical protein [Hyphococcus flavus]WDI30965.1 hypothetical protein PUV54_13475 [Hyphococcus flavus]